ncbi:transcriptional regulator [Photobacterium sp. TY1-4]|uniref:winged helix-turn-helix domain-containing protein n=1 Tax=Photobacterium sp. TY1-4 TaxID=2899122 RepID=UPI0021BF0E79|nr:winged helix-turn-helix domain-containing protein [Photobacterium sp. TY1-4]UXI02146.1 winged helix-turn-helix domain-containing protein [Photobacterium sp. TY1-4]
MHDIIHDAKTTQQRIWIAGLQYDPASRQFFSGGTPIDLEPRTAELVEVLLSSVGTPLSSEAMIQAIWNSRYISKNVLTNRISTLRALLQKHLPDEDATKILVTYPRKGYFFSPTYIRLDTAQCATPAEVVLHTPQEIERQEIEPQADTLSRMGQGTSDSSAPVRSGRWPRFQLSHGLCLLLACCALGFAMLYWHETQSHAQKSRQQQWIPKVELLLNRIDAVGEQARAHRQSIKAIMLEQQIEYPYTDIANQDVPGYFVELIDDSMYWPGARHIRTSDYTLDMRVKDIPNSDFLQAKVRLLFASTEKQVFDATYQINPADLSASLLPIHQDLARYFNLPLPISYDWQARQREEVIHLNDAQAVLSAPALDEFSAVYLARRLALLEHDPEVLQTAVSRIQTQFTPLPDELSMWLGILYYRLGNLDMAYELLTVPVRSARIQNTLIYMLISQIAYQQGKFEQFRLKYLESMVALLRVVPSESLFIRLSESESKETCMQPWLSLQQTVEDEQLLAPWREFLDHYCHVVDQQMGARQVF